MENGSNQSGVDFSGDTLAPSAERPTKIRWLVFALTCSISFVLYLHRYSWAMVKRDISEEFEWDATQLGTLDSVFSATYALGQIPSGILCDWFGPHVLLGSIMMLWSLSMGAVVLATGYGSVLAARGMFGLTQAGCYPTLSKVSKLWFPDDIRTTLQAWIATFFGRGGGAVCFILLGWMLGSLEMPWRTAILILTGLGCAFAVLFLFLFRNSPEEHPWSNDAEAELISEGTPDSGQATGSRLRWSDVLASGNMRWFFLQQFTSAYADNVYVYWIPFFLLTTKNVEIGGAGWMAALPLLGGAVGGMLGGTLQNWLIQKTGNRRWSRSSIGLIGKMLATVFIFVSLSFDSALTIVLIFAMVKFFGDWSQPAVWGTVTDIAGRNTASVFGLINTVGSIAAFVAGPTMGLVIERYAEVNEVQAVRVEPLATATAEGDLYQTSYQLPQKNIVSEVEGAIKFGEDTQGMIKFDEEGNFVTENSLMADAKIKKRNGTIAILWKESPGSHTLVLSYENKEYGSGWTMLFIILGGMYLVSSLSWIFIDCTKTLADEAGQQEGEPEQEQGAEE